eukprot:gene10019-8888_t
MGSSESRPKDVTLVTPVIFRLAQTWCVDLTLAADTEQLAHNPFDLYFPRLKFRMLADLFAKPGAHFNLRLKPQALK